MESARDIPIDLIFRAPSINVHQHFSLLSGLGQEHEIGAMTGPPTPSKKRLLVIWCVMTVAAMGIASLHYRDMAKPLPPFASLVQIPADGMRYQIGKSQSGSQSGFEFFDHDGKRYQSPYLDEGIAMATEEALRQGGVVLWTGPWKSALASDSIFSIYHMTQGDRVLIDYNERTLAKAKEQKAAIPVMAITSVLFTGILVWTHKKNSRS